VLYSIVFLDFYPGTHQLDSRGFRGSGFFAGQVGTVH